MGETGLKQKTERFDGLRFFEARSLERVNYLTARILRRSNSRQAAMMLDGSCELATGGQLGRLGWGY